MVYGHRPKDWFPLTGGDPCPGDPEAWAPVVGHYEQRVEDLRRLRRDHLLPHTSIDADGNRFRRLEQAFSAGAQMLEMAAEEFTNAAETVKDWQIALREMQEEADEALRKAQRIQGEIDHLQQKTNGIRAENPGVNLVAGMQIAVLDFTLKDYQNAVARQQSVVDEVRGRYQRTAQNIREKYHIRSVGDMYLHRKKSNYMSDSYEVFTRLIFNDDALDFDAENLNRLAGEASNGPEALDKFLAELEKLNTGQLATYLASRPDLVRYPLEVSDDVVGNAVVAKNWWAGLSQEKRDILTNSAMGMVGNLEGVPYSARAVANRRLLDTELEEPGLKASAREKLNHIRDVLDNPKAGTDLYLTSLDLSNLNPENEDGYDYNDVLASVALGSIDEADKVSVVVPGMDNNASSLGNLTRVGTNIYNEQKDALKKHGDEGQNLAVEIWIGYETPPSVGQQLNFRDNLVVDLSLADRGGQRLAAHLDGMNVTKSVHSSGEDYSDSSISVIAHSYGTTTTGQAAQYAQTNVDSIVMYGSAGIDIDAVFDANGDGWNVDRDSEGRQKIYYASSIEDWTAPLGYLGSWVYGVVHPYRIGDVRVTPFAIGDADRFQSTEGISADGKYYEDVDTHSFETPEEEDQGFVDTDTTSLYYGARAAAGYEEDLGKRFYEPWYYEYDFSTGERLVKRVTSDDLDESGKVPDHLMEEIRKSQNIPESDLVSGDADD